jgi:hypothetical protein
MKTPILKSVLAAWLAAISMGAPGVEAPQPAILFWDQLTGIPEAYRPYRPLNVDAAARGIEMVGGGMPCTMPLADPPEMAVTGYLVPNVQMVTTRIKAAREYLSLDGARVARFETPEITSGAYPDPRNPPLTIMIAPGPFETDPANPQYSRFSSFDFMGTGYFLEDGSPINARFAQLTPVTTLGCRTFPMRRGSSGIAEAGRQDYFVWSLAMTGSYQLPPYGYYSPHTPPVPPCDTPPCPAPPLPPQPVSDVSVYWFGVYAMNGALFWERTYPGFDSDGWSMRPGIGISGVADHLRGHRGDEVLVARSRPVAGTNQVEYWYQYLELATGNLLLERHFTVASPILAPVAPPPPAALITVSEPPAPCPTGSPPPCM